MRKFEKNNAQEEVLPMGSLIREVMLFVAGILIGSVLTSWLIIGIKVRLAYNSTEYQEEEIKIGGST